MASISLTVSLSDPTRVVDRIEALPCVDSAVLVRGTSGRVVFGIDLLPYDATGFFVALGYPIEPVHLVIFRNGEVRAVPKSRPGRRWKHRNGRMGVMLDLCLWDPHDARALQWSWADGLEEYVRIVARHLIYEEFWRRTGEWPVEDSPHGDPEGGAWPIQTVEMRQEVRRWGHG